MHITGIIAEYNPFHNGHQYHIEQTRKLTNCDILVCVMSSNFVQRGEPAVCNKWERAKAAIIGGCDIVIELPFIYATQSATQFAAGAIACLKQAQVQDIVFGSETNDIDMLQTLCKIDAEKYKDLMKEGLSPVKAYEIIYGNMNANDILGINYVKELQDSNIKPYTIKRTNAYHNEVIDSNIASATAIRKALYKNEDIYSVTPMAHMLTTDFDFSRYYPYIRTLLLTQTPEYLASLFMMDEGIEHQLIKNARKCSNLQDFLTLSTSKRYTTSRIKRTLVHLMNQTSKQQVNTLPRIDYIRVLAFNSAGKQYLKSIKEQTKIASRFNQIPSAYRTMELRATQVYAFPLAEDEKQLMMHSELQPPIYLK